MNRLITRTLVSRSHSFRTPVLGQTRTLVSRSHSFRTPVLGQRKTNTPSRSFSAAGRLHELLSREIDEEVGSGHLEMPPVLKDLYDDVVSKGWKYEDVGEVGGALVNERKGTPSGMGGVRVEFFGSDMNDFDNSDDGDYIDEEGEEEEDIAIDYTVIVGNNTMVFDCTTLPTTGIQINSLIHRPPGKELDEANTYTGPNFDTLPSDVVDGSVDYLVDDCGVDDDVEAFVGMMGDWREQAAYVSWMKGINDVLKN